MAISSAGRPTIRKKSRHFAIAQIVLALAAAWLFMRSAWLSDDAFISLRQVEMFVTGEGMVWNLGERVQAFTHPAWFMILALGRTLSGSLYYMTIVLSGFCVAFALWSYWTTCRRSDHHLVTALLLMALPVLSIPFRDYMTSGLENPLSFVLIAAVFALLTRLESRNARRMLWIVLALALLNRQDLALQFGPLAAWLLFRRNALSEVVVATPGIAMLVAWFAFATFYFGAPLPNTYFAKLSAGIPQETLSEFGLRFLVINLVEYPFTSAVILAGTVFGLAGRTPDKLIAAGVILHLVYLVRIGGDFMLGRFLTVDFLLACFMLARFSPASPKPVGSVAVLLVFTALVTEPSYRIKTELDPSSFNIVADERQFYYYSYGLLSPTRDWPVREAGEPDSREVTHVVMTCGLIGGARIRWPDTIFIVDSCGLTNPFLSRIPVAQSSIPSVRPGHYPRTVPANYGDVILGTDAVLADLPSGELWDDVQLVGRAPLFDPARLAAVRRLAARDHDFSLNAWTHPESAGFETVEGEGWLTPKPERRYSVFPSEAHRIMLKALLSDTDEL